MLAAPEDMQHEGVDHRFVARCGPRGSKLLDEPTVRRFLLCQRWLDGDRIHGPIEPALAGDIAHVCKAGSAAAPEDVHVVSATIDPRREAAEEELGKVVLYRSHAIQVARSL